MYVKSVLPEAKFIFIHRHPIHIINSKLKAVRSILNNRNAYTALISEKYQQLFNKPAQRFVYRLLYSSLFNLGLRTVTKKSVMATNYFLQNVDALPKTDYLSVRYEDLCEDPQTNVLRILSFLELKPRSNLAYETLIAIRPLRLLPEVAKKYDDIRQQLQPYFVNQGYDT